MRNKYQRKEHKSNHKFEVVGGRELLLRVPLPLAEVWAEMQAQVEELTGHAGLQILRAILNIQRSGLHAFRHSAASMMDRLNTPLKLRQQRLGHMAHDDALMEMCTSRLSDAEMTLGVYSHVADPSGPS